MKRGNILIVLVVFALVISPYSSFIRHSLLNDRVKVLPFSEPVNFSNDNGYKGTGWYDSEPGLTWTNGNEAHIRFRTTQQNIPVTFTMNFYPFIYGNLIPEQRVMIYLNNKLIEDFSVSTQITKKIHFPSELVKRKMDIKIELPNGNTSPLVLGISNDERNLGLAVQSIMLEKDIK